MSKDVQFPIATDTVSPDRELVFDVLDRVNRSAKKLDPAKEMVLHLEFTNEWDELAIEHIGRFPGLRLVTLPNGLTVTAEKFRAMTATGKLLAGHSVK